MMYLYALYAEYFFNFCEISVVQYLGSAEHLFWLYGIYYSLENHGLSYYIRDGKMKRV